MKHYHGSNLSDNNPYKIMGYDDEITCCYNFSGQPYAGCKSPSVWFYGYEGDVFFRCDRHRYPVNGHDDREGPGPWQEMTRQEIAEEWEVHQVMEA